MAAPRALSRTIAARGRCRRGADFSTCSWSAWWMTTSNSRRVTPTCSPPTNFEISDRSSLAARLLLSDDDLKLVTDDDADDVDSAGTGRSAHLWLEFDHAWTDALQMNTIAVGRHRQSAARFARQDEHRVGTVHSDNDFRFLDLQAGLVMAVERSPSAALGFQREPPGRRLRLRARGRASSIR